MLTTILKSSFIFLSVLGSIINISAKFKKISYDIGQIGQSLITISLASYFFLRGSLLIGFSFLLYSFADVFMDLGKWFFTLIGVLLFFTGHILFIVNLIPTFEINSANVTTAVILILYILCLYFLTYHKPDIRKFLALLAYGSSLCILTIISPNIIMKIGFFIFLISDSFIGYLWLVEKAKRKLTGFQIDILLQITYGLALITITGGFYEN